MAVARRVGDDDAAVGRDVEPLRLDQPPSSCPMSTSVRTAVRASFTANTACARRSKT
jgi:hypothetical protein